MASSSCAESGYLDALQVVAERWCPVALQLLSRYGVTSQVVALFRKAVDDENENERRLALYSGDVEGAKRRRMHRPTAAELRELFVARGYHHFDAWGNRYDVPEETQDRDAECVFVDRVRCARSALGGRRRPGVRRARSTGPPGGEDGESEPGELARLSVDDEVASGGRGTAVA
jgi:hypothetical protein